MATVVTLKPYNTVTLAATTVYQLVGPGGAGQILNIINLGPGSLYIRADADPSVGDANSFQVPASNTQLLSFPVIRGSNGLRVISDQAGKISVQMTSR